MSDSNNNADKAHRNLQEDNSTDKTESNEDIYQRLRKYSTLDGATILQIDATMIVGVLFFLTLTSFLDVEEEFSRILTVIMTSAIVFPFSVSGILVLSANVPLQAEILSLLFKEKSLQVMKEKDYRRIARNSRLALTFTIVGFVYLISVLGIFAYLVYSNLGLDIHTTAEKCGKDPRRYGINETDVWRWFHV